MKNEKFYSIRKGVVYVDEWNYVIPVTSNTPFRTHLGAMAAPVTWATQVGNWTVVFQGQVQPFTLTTEVDAGLLLLELLHAPEASVYMYWIQNNARSTRKLPPICTHSTAPSRGRIMCDPSRARRARIAKGTLRAAKRRDGDDPL